MTTSTTKYLMHPVTGFVQSEADWRDEVSGWEGNDVEGQFKSLVEVVPENGQPVPEDFNAVYSGSLAWVEV